MRTRTTLATAAAITAATLLGWLMTSDRPATTRAKDKAATADPLPSWNDGPSKKAVIEFVTKMTKGSGPEFVPREERIATFNNDGTLWVEQPMYTQLAFAIDRVKALAPKYPEWKVKQPFQAVLAGDLKGMAAAGHKGLVELIMATHAGMTTEEFCFVAGERQTDILRRDEKKTVFLRREKRSFRV